MILNSPLSTQQLLLVSTTNCESLSQQKQNQGKTGPKYIKEFNVNRQGDLAEHLVSIAAWKRGAEVFMNLGRTGAIDIVLRHEKRTPKHLDIDVKSMTKDGKGIFGANGSCYKAKCPVALIHPFTEQIRWIRGKEPSGWEDFWN